MDQILPGQNQKCQASDCCQREQCCVGKPVQQETAEDGAGIDAVQGCCVVVGKTGILLIAGHTRDQHVDDQQDHAPADSDHKTSQCDHPEARNDAKCKTGRKEGRTQQGCMLQRKLPDHAGSQYGEEGTGNHFRGERDRGQNRRGESGNLNAACQLHRIGGEHCGGQVREEEDQEHDQAQHPGGKRDGRQAGLPTARRAVILSPPFQEIDDLDQAHDTDGGDRNQIQQQLPEEILHLTLKALQIRSDFNQADRLPVRIKDRVQYEQIAAFQAAVDILPADPCCQDRLLFRILILPVIGEQHRILVHGIGERDGVIIPEYPVHCAVQILHGIRSDFEYAVYRALNSQIVLTQIVGRFIQTQECVNGHMFECEGSAVVGLVKLGIIMLLGELREQGCDQHGRKCADSDQNGRDDPDHRACPAQQEEGKKEQIRQKADHQKHQTEPHQTGDQSELCGKDECTNLLALIVLPYLKCAFCSRNHTEVRGNTVAGLAFDPGKIFMQRGHLAVCGIDGGHAAQSAVSRIQSAVQAADCARNAFEFFHIPGVIIQKRIVSPVCITIDSSVEGAVIQARFFRIPHSIQDQIRCVLQREILRPGDIESAKKQTILFYDDRSGITAAGKERNNRRTDLIIGSIQSPQLFQKRTVRGILQDSFLFQTDAA